MKAHAVPAVRSPDHLCPLGAIFDNTPAGAFLYEVEEKLGEYASILDLGCAGGQLAVDFHEAGHVAVGLEGSPHARDQGMYNWPKHGGSVLLVADVTQQFWVTDDSNYGLEFDLVTAWEVLEHIAEYDLPNFFANALGQLGANGLFVASVNTLRCDRRGADGKMYELHQTVATEDRWRRELLPKALETTGRVVLDRFPFAHPPRCNAGSFLLGIA